METTLQKTAIALSQLTPSGPGPSKSFQLLVRAIGEAKTKHEEDRIMKRESAILKEKMASRDINTRQMREYLIRLLYCEMLGVNCSWGHIHAVTFTQSNNIVDKRIGYLTCSLVLHPDHELNMLLVNSIQRDLRSSNMLEVSMALIIICRLISGEMIPALLPLVREKLHHPKELVRKKALLAMHHFYQCSSSSVEHLGEDFRRALSDPDPGVMEAALILLHDIIKDDPSQHKDLVSAFVSILSQVVSRRLPSEFDYHGVPAPWIQLRLLRILALLGADDSKSSEEMYTHLENTLASAECNSNVGQAITYECIRTVTSIYPRPVLIKKAADSIARFLKDTNNNWKYLGITSLASLVQVEPKYALDYQIIVIDCLDDPDETLKRKTLDLLYKMTNPANVKEITSRLISYLRTVSNEFIKADLVAKLTQLAERFSPDNQWFIETMNSIFEIGGNLVRREVAHNLMRLIAEGTEDDEIDKELRNNAVLSYLELLDKPHLPDILIKIICWVVGEYAYVAEDIEMEDIIEKITGLMNNEYEDPQTRSCVINAITRLVAQLGYLPDYVHSQVALNLTSVDTDVQQRCSELLELSESLQLMQDVLPLDSSCEDLEVDSSLSFLDSFVAEALVQGAPPYKPPHLRNAMEKPTPSQSSQPVIKFQPYDAPTKPSHSFISSSVGGYSPSSFQKEFTSSPTPTSSMKSTSQVPPISPTTGNIRRVSSGDSSVKNVDLFQGIQLKGERKWGREGYKKTTPIAISSSNSSNIENQEDIHTDEERHVTTSSLPPEILNGGTRERKPDSSVNIQVSRVEAKPHLTPEQKRKSDMASALFTGLSGPSRPVKTKEKSITLEVIKREGQTRSLSQSSGTDMLLDLQDLDFSQSTTSTEAVTNTETRPLAQPTETTGPTSLFDNLLMTTPEDTPITTVSEDEQIHAKSVPSTSDDLIGLFDSPLTTVDTAKPNVSDTSTSNTPLIMDSTPLLPMTTDSSTSLPQQQTTALAIMDAPLSSSSSLQLPVEITSHPVVQGWDKKELSRDVQMRITASKILKPDQLILVLILTNQKQSGVDNITLTIEPPSNLKVTTQEETTDLTWKGELDGFANCAHILHIVPSSPSITMSMKGELTYRDHLGTQRRLFYDLSVSISDLIRPLKLITPEFGKKWGSSSNEKKLKMATTNIQKPSDFMELMSNQFNFHPIEIIKSEGITAGTYLPSTPCLVHGKITPNFLEVWIRTPSGLLTEAIAKQFQTIKQ